MTAETFKKLDDYNHARIRTEMYLGSREVHTQDVLGFDGASSGVTPQTWTPSLYTAFRELLDNALDEMVAHGHGDTLEVGYNSDDMIITVTDNGRGLPIHEISELGKGPAASILLGEARAGRNFDERGDVAGVNGLGAAMVNFTAEWFELTVYRDGKKFHQKWHEGKYRKKDIHRTDGPVITTYRGKKTGTIVSFKPSSKVWGNMILPSSFVLARMWDIAMANPTLNVLYNGKKLECVGRDPVRSVMFADKNAGLIDIVTDRVKSKFYIVAGITDNEHVHSLVNNIPVFNGGPHVDEFRNLFHSALIKILDKDVKDALGVKSRTDKILTKNDVSQGLLIYNITLMSDPHFDSQTKTRLVSEIKSDIRSGFFESDVRGFLRKNPKWVQEVIDRCRSRTQNATNRVLAKEQRKLSSNKVVTLKDATGKNRRACTLFITEGESALAGMMSARDASIHGGLPLTGKIMNVYGVTPKKVLASKALTNIMGSLGLKIGEPANKLHLRYGRVYICTDADEDGKNILALVVNFLYRFWPELFEGEPFVYHFDTPLVILTKGKKREYVYADGYRDFNPEDWKGWQIIRAKGLARLTQPDWKSAIENPKLIPLTNDGALSDTLDLIFNTERSKDRQIWLSND